MGSYKSSTMRLLLLVLIGIVCADCLPPSSFRESNRAAPRLVNPYRQAKMAGAQVMYQNQNQNQNNYKKTKNAVSDTNKSYVVGVTVETKGFCLNSEGKDQNVGVKGRGTGLSKEKCWMLCRHDKGSKGCEYHHPTGSCSFHTKFIAASNGKPDTSCLHLF